MADKNLTDSKKVSVMGRPLKYPTPQHLADVIEEYLNSTDIEKWTVTGLCLAIGTPKQVLNDYEKREGYKDVVKLAKLHIEHSYELSLRLDGGSNNIFALKNFGWTDKQETIDIEDESGKAYTIQIVEAKKPG